MMMTMIWTSFVEHWPAFLTGMVGGLLGGILGAMPHIIKIRALTARMRRQREETQEALADHLRDRGKRLP